MYTNREFRTTTCTYINVSCSLRCPHFRVLSHSCLQDLFASMAVVEAEELGLGGNAPLSDIHRLHWNTNKGWVCTYIYTQNKFKIHGFKF